jgi:hypothetical protein
MEKKITWANLISFIFHPLVLPTFGISILLFIPSYIALSIPLNARRLIIGLVFVNTFLGPLLVIFLMKKIGIIQDVSLREKHERIYPTLVSALFYLFTFYLFRQANLPSVLGYFIAGATLVVLAGFTVSYYWKISFHMLSMGGFTAYLILISLILGHEMHFLILSSILISGLLGSARIILNAHTPAQVYVGYITGAGIMVLLFFWLNG